jgi:hypothetical protein
MNSNNLRGYALIALTMLSLIIPALVYGGVLSWSDNSSYKYWYGHKVGATTAGVWWDSTVTAPDMPRIELGASGAVGQGWSNDPLPGEYWVETDSFTLQLKAIDVWVDKDNDGVQDPGEPDGYTTDVYFVLVHTGDCGSATNWDTLVSLIWGYASSLSGVILPNPFDLIDFVDEDDAQETLVVVLYPDDFGSVRTRVDYYGDEVGKHHITIQCKTSVWFNVWREDAGRRGIESSIAYHTTINQTKNIEIVMTVT